MINTDIDHKIQEYLQQLENNPEAAEIYASLSSLYAQKQQWQEAVIAAKKALSINPKFAGAYRNLARILTHLGKEEAATECWFKAYDLEPSWAEAEDFCRLGNSLLKYQRVDRAFICYLRALKLNPNFAEAYYKLGLILTQQGQYSEAIEAYIRAIEYSSRGSELQRQAFISYEKNLTTNLKTTAKEFYELARLFRAKNFITEAVIAYQQAIRINPLLFAAHSDLSYTNIPEKQLPELIEFYRKIVIEYPELPEAWSNLGDFLTKQGQEEEAIVCYQKSCYYRTIKDRPHLIAWVWKKQENSAPDFIIAGATKCGTTSLYKYLDKHPQIIVSRKKEIDFFNRHFARGLDWYLSQFPFLDDRSFITGEASPNYLDAPIAARNMYQTFPNIKLIILLRNPIEKAVSSYYHKLHKGLAQDNYSLQEAVSKELESLSRIPSEKLARSSYKDPNNILGSLYYYRLQSWFDLFPREQILIIKSEDLYQNTSVIMTEVYQFLGLPPHHSNEYLVWNYGTYVPIDDPDLRRTLADYFKPHNQKLEEFLGRKFDWS
jgi:tetratricopeptide (TPR) repeat protein